MFRTSPMAGLLFALALVDVAAARWVWCRRRAAGRTALTVLLVGVAVWCAAYSLQLATFGRTSREVWGSLQFVGTAVLPPAWLAFVLEYTGRREQITRRLIAVLSVEPLIVLTLLAIPATHHLIRSFPPGPVPAVPVVELGAGFWWHFGYTNGLALVATGLLVSRLARASSSYRRQSIILSAAAIMPLLANAASSVNLPLATTYDLTPVALSLSGMIVVWGAFRYHLLDLLPVARNLAFDRLGDPILVTDHAGRIVDRNPAAAATLGSGTDVGATLQDLLLDSEARLDATPAGAEIRIGQGEQVREYEVVASPLGDRNGRRTGQLVHLRDITARKDAERRLRHLADYDHVTGLPNRRLLAHLLDQAISRARRSNGRCGLLFLDLDRFKMLNDTLGHERGDQVLAAVGARLRVGGRDEDVAARLGGDEFALLLPELSCPEDAAVVARRVLAALAEPVQLGDREVIVTASIGVAVWPDDGSDGQQLFGCADMAMYRAKAHGRNRAESGVLVERPATDRLALGVGLRRALRGDELFLAYQPIVALHGGALLGLEALVRWRHPRLGVLMPSEFLSVAEDAGLAAELDRWVLARACEQAAGWSGVRAVPVSVNVSAQCFRNAPITIAADVDAVLARTRLPPELLVLEIDERTVVDDPEPVARELQAVRRLGVTLALDDFGAGHTSLTHLRRLPIDILKIDHDLVHGATEGAEDLRILCAVTTLAQILRMTVVAEGVERSAHVEVLERAGCDAGQGFLFSAPLPADEVGALLSASAAFAPALP